MRIAMLSWESMHSIAVGGIAPHVTELSVALARRGHEVHIFTRMGMWQSRYDCVDGVHYHRCPFEPDGDFVVYVRRMCDSFVWHLAETEHFLGASFDVVHGHDWLTSAALAQIKNDRARPVVMTMHSTEFGRCGNSIWDDPMSERIRHLEWEGTYVADRVICVSKTLAAETQQLYSVPTDKVFPVYNGVDVAKYDTIVDVHEVRLRHRVGADDAMLLFAGRMTWQKGPDLLLEAVPGILANQPGTKFIFAGEGDMRPGLEDRAVALGVDSKTRFLGHRSGNELVGLFKASDLVCVPSRNEPFGIVILEAWSASKAVLATLTGGPAEFVKNDYTGLTVETGIETIGRGVSALLSDPENTRQMGINGRREAEARFTWDHAAVATENVYECVRPNGTLGSATEESKKTREVMAGKIVNGPTVRKNGNTAAASKTPSVSKLTMNGIEPTQDQIRACAHKIYLARNGTPGNATSDWLQAERELRNEKPPKTTAQTEKKRR